MTRWMLIAAAALWGCGSKQTPVAQPTPTPEETPTPTPENGGHEHGHGSPGLAALAEGAQLFDDLGTFHRPISTKSDEAQKYFDQGLRLTYGFNHDEATRSFAKAAAVDPTCAMCFWGIGFTLGPNYNMIMMPHQAKNAWDAVQKATELAAGASPVEQALIGALAKRYKGPEPLEPPAQQPFSEAYAAAMREVAAKFPDDLDVQTLFAESLMNLNPWQLWSLDGKPGANTEEIVATLEKVLAAAPDHPGANHYYIHAVEASPHPEKAVPSAERVGALIPGAGHLVHMPAHIFHRVGRYEDSAEANRNAVKSDLAYLGKTNPPGYYPMYIAHNYHFLAFSAAAEGRGAEALEAARATAKMVTPELLAMMPGADYFMAPPFFVMVRFGRWDDLVAEPAPDGKLRQASGYWHFAHGVALAAKGKPDDAAADLEALRKLREEVPPEELAGFSPAKDVLGLAATVLEARIAWARGDKKGAVAKLEEAVKVEDGLAYNEPETWFFPTRHLLGAALLQSNRAKDAEAVYREDLRRHPGNGWALTGLVQALAKQRRKSIAETAALKQAWANADTKIAASAF